MPTLISTHVCTGIHSGLSSSGLRIQTLYSNIIFFSMQVTCLTHLTLLDSIIPMLFVEEKKLCNPSLCSFLKPLISSLSRPHVLFPSILMAALGLPVMWESRFHIHTEHQVDCKDSSWLGYDAASTGSVWPFGDIMFRNVGDCLLLGAA